MSPKEILSHHYLGQKIKSFEFGNIGTGYDTLRECALGKMITYVDFGFNNSGEDAGIFLNVEGIDGPIFVYDIEDIIFEE